MYANIRRYRMGAGSVDDAMHLADIGLADRIAAEPGFVDYRAIDTGDGMITSITIFEDEDPVPALQRLGRRVRARARRGVRGGADRRLRRRGDGRPRGRQGPTASPPLRRPERRAIPARRCGATRAATAEREPNRARQRFCTVPVASGSPHDRTEDQRVRQQLEALIEPGH